MSSSVPRKPMTLVESVFKPLNLPVNSRIDQLSFDDITSAYCHAVYRLTQQGKPGYPDTARQKEIETAYWMLEQMKACQVLDVPASNRNRTNWHTFNYEKRLSALDQQIEKDMQQEMDEHEARHYFTYPEGKGVQLDSNVLAQKRKKAQEEVETAKDILVCWDDAVAGKNRAVLNRHVTRQHCRTEDRIREIFAKKLEPLHKEIKRIQSEISRVYLPGNLIAVAQKKFGLGGALFRRNLIQYVTGDFFPKTLNPMELKQKIEDKLKQPKKNSHTQKLQAAWESANKEAKEREERLLTQLRNLNKKLCEVTWRQMTCPKMRTLLNSSQIKEIKGMMTRISSAPQHDLRGEEGECSVHKRLRGPA